MTVGKDPAPDGAVVARVWLPASRSGSGVGGPTPVAIRDGGVFDLSGEAATMADLLERADLLQLVMDARAPRVADLDEVVGRPRGTAASRSPSARSNGSSRSEPAARRTEPATCGLDSPTRSGRI